MGIIGRGGTKVNGLWEVCLSAALLKVPSWLSSRVSRKIHGALTKPTNIYRLPPVKQAPRAKRW